MSDLSSSAALLSLLRGRRSIRRFRPDPVPEEAVLAMAEAASWAPSARNRQGYRLAAVASAERIGAMAEAVRVESARLREALRDRVPDAYVENFLHFANAPLVFAAFYRTGVHLQRAVGADSSASQQIAADALSSMAAAIQNLLLCAHALGLGACWMTAPLIAEAALAPILQVPDGWKLSALIPVGFPAEEPPAPPRRRLDQILRRL